MKKKHGIEKIAVIGAGVMGHGIAQEFAIAGFDVRLTARSELSLNRAVDNIKANTSRLLSMGQIDSSQVQLAMDNVTTTTSIQDAVDGVDMVMEYVAEDIESCLMEIDVYYQNVIQQKFDCYFTHPSMCVQKPSWSDITQRDACSDFNKFR